MGSQWLGWSLVNWCISIFIYLYRALSQAAHVLRLQGVTSLSSVSVCCILRQSQSLTGNHYFVLVVEAQHTRAIALLNLESVAQAVVVLACLADRLQQFLNHLDNCGLISLDGFALRSEVSY